MCKDAVFAADIGFFSHYSYEILFDRFVQCVTPKGSNDLDQDPGDEGTVGQLGLVGGSKDPLDEGGGELVSFLPDPLVLHAAYDERIPI